MKPQRFEQHRSKSSMMCNRFSDFNVKSDIGKTPLIVLRCADNRQLFEGTGERIKAMIDVIKDADCTKETPVRLGVPDAPIYGKDIKLKPRTFLILMWKDRRL